MPHRQMTLEVVDTPEELHALGPGWEALAAAAADANPFYEPWMLLPACRAGIAQGRCRFLACFGGAVNGKKPLMGLFPLGEHGPGALPAMLLSSWSHQHVYLGTPLVHREAVDPVVGALFDWLGTQARGPGLVLLSQIAEGPVHRALVEALFDRGWANAVVDRFARAVFRPAEDPDTYLRNALGSRKVRDLRRRQERLGEQGALSYVALDRPEDVPRWTQEFLTLEASGWKGRNGTALACTAANRAFFTQVMEEASARGCLEGLSLCLDGRPIAMLVNFWSGSAGIAFKIAYDERYARYGPGILLEAECLRRRHAKPTDWLDSCASPRASHLKRLYADRRLIETIVFAPKPGRGPLVQLFCAMNTLKHKLANRLRGQEPPHDEPPSDLA